MASSSVGGLSGAFIPVSEDAGMIRAVQAGALSLAKLEAMTAVCSVGLDMVAVPGDTSEATLAGIIADEMAIGVREPQDDRRAHHPRAGEEGRRLGRVGRAPRHRDRAGPGALRLRGVPQAQRADPRSARQLSKLRA